MRAHHVLGAGLFALGALVVGYAVLTGDPDASTGLLVAATALAAAGSVFAAVLYRRPAAPPAARSPDPVVAPRGPGGLGWGSVRRLAAVVRALAARERPRDLGPAGGSPEVPR